MSESFGGDMEGLLRRAFEPVEPPADLAMRLESTLTGLAELAADELERWELSSMRDPRNWLPALRPAAAVAIGGTAGAALVVLRVRRQHRRRETHASDPLDFAGRTLRSVAEETRKLLDR